MDIQAEQFGFKYIMIDDNPSMGVGDNYSPKQVLSSVKTDSVLYLDNFGRTKKIISQDKHYENQKLFKQLVKTYVVLNHHTFYFISMNAIQQ
jgi:hypothetical protein